jgi:hypothetical protein
MFGSLPFSPRFPLLICRRPRRFWASLLASLPGGALPLLLLLAPNNAAAQQTPAPPRPAAASAASAPRMTADPALDAPSSRDDAEPGGPRDTVIFRGAADLRARETDKEADSSYLAAARLTTDWVRRDVVSGRTQGGARVQFYLENEGPRSTGARRLRPSEVYGTYEFRLPGVSATLKAGQFALPFGLTAGHDPLQIIQPLYENSLGLRVDMGVMLEGEYEPYRYAVALTTGAGPNRGDHDSNKMVTFRLERTLPTPYGRFTLGGSLLSGRGPLTTVDAQLPASGTSRVRQFVNKTRFGADGQYEWNRLAARGEIVFGGDDEDPAWGYFAEGNFHATPRLTLVAMRRLWVFSDSIQIASSTGLGANYHFGDNFTLRALYEFQRDVPFPAGTAPRVAKRLTLQTRLNF